MRGVSAGSQQATLEAVEQTVSSGADAARLGDDLFRVVDVLDAQPALRRVLTDPASSAQAKADLAENLFGGKVVDGAVTVLKAATEGRWNSTLDLPDALETAGVSAHVIGADSDGSLDELEDELFRFGQVVKGDPELRATLTDRAVEADRRRELVGSLLDGRATRASSAIARQAAATRRRSFETTLESFGELVAERRERLVATVTTAYPLADDEKSRLADALSGHYDRPVHLNEIIDPSVLGGLAVEIGPERIDGTVSTKLDDARRRIAG